MINNEVMKKLEQFAKRNNLEIIEFRKNIHDEEHFDRQTPSKEIVYEYLVEFKGTDPIIEDK